MDDPHDSFPCCYLPCVWSVGWSMAFGNWAINAFCAAQERQRERIVWGGDRETGD